MQVTVTMGQLCAVGFVGAAVTLIGWHVFEFQSKILKRVAGTISIAFLIVFAYSGFSLLRTHAIELQKEQDIVDAKEAKVAEITRAQKEKRRAIRRERDAKVRLVRQEAEARQWDGGWDFLRDTIGECRGDYRLIRYTLEQFKEQYNCGGQPLTRDAYLELRWSLQNGGRNRNVKGITPLVDIFADNYLDCVAVLENNMNVDSVASAR